MGFIGLFLPSTDRRAKLLDRVVATCNYKVMDVQVGQMLEIYFFGSSSYSHSNPRERRVLHMLPAPSDQVSSGRWVAVSMH